MAIIIFLKKLNVDLNVFYMTWGRDLPDTKETLLS